MNSFFSAMRSTLSSFIGVQSEKQREEDFTNGKPIHFIVSGLILAAAFVVVLMLVVEGVLALAQK